MANSDIVTPAREILYTGDVSYKRANSEAIMSRFAATNNFVATYQNDIKEWKLNGSYSIASGITFYDGVASFFYNSEIVGVNFYNGQSGTSGITEFDVIWKNANGDTQGSIFSTTPKISTTANDETIAFKNLVTNTVVSPAGVTLPTFFKTQFLEGESLYLKLNSAMTEASNCGLTLFYRPIN